MNRHSLFCLRTHVLAEVTRHVNLSTSEREWLFALQADVNPCCNCKMTDSRIVLDMGTLTKATLVENTTRMVLDHRRMASRGEHPAGKSWVMGGGDTLGIMLDDAGSGEGAQVIRIDFRNRRRII